MEIKLEIQNLNKIKDALSKAPALTIKEVDEAVKKSIYEVERESKELTPVDTGRLRGGYRINFSILKGKISIKPRKTKKGKTNYAIYVHENLKAHHKVGEAKFLEKGMNIAKKNIEKYFNQAIKNVFNKIASLSK
jgi:hypothetical protein